MRFALFVVAVLTTMLLSSDGSGANTVSASGDYPIAGDTDCDLTISALDALGIVQAEAGVDPGPECLEFADVNCDGAVDMRDMIDLLRHLAELSPTGIPVSCPQIGSASGLPALVFGVDNSIDVKPDAIAGVDGGPPRPLAAVVDDDGAVSLFVENELVIVTDDIPALDAFLARWNATLLKTIDAADVGVDMSKMHLVRLDPTGVDEAQFANDLRSVNENAWGEFDISSQDGLELMGVAAGEAAGGVKIDLNWVAEGSTLAQREISESANRNPFNDFSYMSRGSVQNMGVAEAWRAMGSANTLINRVTVAILDGGFAPNADFPVGYEMNGPSNVQNPASCTGGSPCPWHGTMVTAAAMGVPDNNFGTAGPAGLIANPVLTQSPSLDFFSVIRYVFSSITQTAWARPSVINISAGGGIPQEFCLTGICQGLHVLASGIRGAGTIIVAAAGNENDDVDEERCINLLVGKICYEKKLWVPCELDFVVCVGGLKDDSTDRDPLSNWGSDGGVDIFGPMTQYETPNPADQFVAYNGCGTSCAAPFIAGVMALIKAANPDLSMGDVQDIMMDSAHRGSADPKVNRWPNVYEAVIFAMGGNHPPEMRIDQPGGTVPGGIPLELSVTLTDAEDLPFGYPWYGIPGVQWFSGIDGLFATGPNLQDVVLSYGTQTITATAIDSSGFYIRDEIELNVVNYAPVVGITSPADAASFFEGQTIQFRGTSGDLNRVSGKLNDSELQWTRTPIGGGTSTPLGTGHLLSTTLPQGQWTIGLLGTDDQGLTSFDSVDVTVLPPPADLPPTASILSAVPPSCLRLYFQLSGAAADDEDGQLTGASLVWTNSVNSFQATGTSVQMPVSGIPQNTPFTITLTATDSNNGTGTDSIEVQWSCIF